MLVCPQCQFENPDTHKFCQKCGVSLTELICPACDASVPTNVAQCPHCGANTGVIWWGLVSSIPASPAPEAAGSSTSAAASPALPEIDAPQTSPLVAAQYLDVQQRYQLLEPLAEPLSNLQNEVTLRVLDCQPYQPASLAWVEQQKALPTSVQPYLTLNAQQHPSLPQLHDAWEQDGRVVLLLEDRSTLPLLSEVWSDQELQPLQVLHWLYQMTELWGILHPYGYGQSLLIPDNVRVDEDYLICLQRLVLDLPETSAGLQDLGRLWQQLLQQSQHPQLDALVQLSQHLQTGEVVALEQLRSQFEAIANELQPTSFPPTVESDLACELEDMELDDFEEEEPTAKFTPEFLGQTKFNDPASFRADRDIVAGAPQVEMSTSEDDVVIDGDDVPTVVLPMKLISLEDAGRTDVGRQRDHNEDHYSIQADIKKVEGPSGRTLTVKGLYILCDGMGGHAGGEVASAMAVDTLKQYFEANWQDQLPNEATIREAIYLANKSIYDLNQENARSGSGRMGTTLVLVLVRDTHVAIAHVGDSRLYRFSRRRGLEQITTDHEVGQREIQRGVEPAIAYARPDAYQLTQALGPRDENFVSPDVQFMEINEDLLLLLCSDGLTDNDLLETHWRTHLEPLLSIQSNLEQGVNQLIDLANHFNGHDNITSVVIRTKVRPNLEQIKR
jgi:protein phosphatase